jgi:threonine synthase
MTKYYYGKNHNPLSEGRKFRNARLFYKVEPDATDVLIDGNYPAVAEAYAKIDGVHVETLIPPKPAPVAASALRSQAAPAQQSLPQMDEQLTSEQAAAVPIPADWRQASWAVLRQLAASVSNTKIINKAQAIEVIEAELKRRESEGQL